MHYMTHRSHRMQKHKFTVTCLNALFVKSIPVPPEHEQNCANVLQLGLTGMHYMSRGSHRMQKHKLSVTCASVIFVKSVPLPLEYEKKCVDVYSPDARKCTT
jgi:hypothetical protein